MPLLMVVETNSWLLQIAGKERQLPPFIESPKSTIIEVNGKVELKIRDRKSRNLRAIVPGTLIAPTFFENTRYDFYLKSEDPKIALQLPPAASRRHIIDNVTHFALNFRNDVGWAELQIHDGTEILALRFEVFPLKIDYRTDYVQMRDEVSKIAHNLAMTVQARTFGLADPVWATRPTLTEKLSLLQYYFDELMEMGKAIARNPHSRLEESVENVPIERARKIDNKALNRILRNPVRRVDTALPEFGIQLPRRVPESTKKITFDTVENRYLKALLFEVRHNLRQVIRSETTGDEDADLSAEQKFFNAIRSEAKSMLKRLQKYLLRPFLQEVANVPPTPPNSMVLTQHPYYARFAQIARLLNSGLSLGGEVLRIGVKDIALLYEYWCFLKLVELLNDRFQLEQQTVVKIQRLRTTVVLKKGVKSSVRFRDPSSGKRLYVVYNRLFRDIPTIAQKPDNVVQIASEEDVFYVFDTKYRLSFDNKYRRRFGGIGPKTADINTMHRYRDAIALPHPLRAGEYTRGIVKEAIVLFPYTDGEDYKNHRFYKSLDLVGIGGLPFLPGTTELVENKLESILNIFGL